ncbi:MAG: hypothetical protein R3E95_05355 [Thiolinea sp.]
MCENVTATLPGHGLSCRSYFFICGAFDHDIPIPLAARPVAGQPGPVAAIGGNPYDSSYTSIRSADCQTLSRDEHGGIVQRCPSFNGVGVKVLEGDLRQSITLVLDGRDRPLDFWTWVTPGFSSLGDLVEWRHVKRHPEQIAGMIVRLTAAENPDPERTTSYLVVSKLTADEVCVVGKVPPQVRENQNVKARALAERAAEMPCLSQE